MHRPVKLSDVARAAGVSLGTASNAFNRPERVRPEVREHIHATAREMGYAGPDPVGRMLMGGKAHALGLIPPGAIPVATALRSPFFREFTFGVAEACDAHAASLLMISGDDPGRKAWTIRNALVDAFVFGHTDEVAIAATRGRKVPAVVMDMVADAGVGSVRIDARGGARRMAEHLLELGHRRFALASVQRTLGAPILHPPGRNRRLHAGYAIDAEKLSGIAAALAAAGLDIDEAPIVEFYPHYPDLPAGARLLLDSATEATAIICMADRQALEVLAEASRRAIAVPGQLSVAGFDDASEAAGASPPLTTIRQPITEKGRIAANMALEGRTGEVVLPVELILRGSTAPPPAERC